MINQNILNILKSSFQDPSYSVIITDFQQPEFCNKNQLQMIVQQFNPNLEKIIENNERVIEELKKILEENDIEVPESLYALKINSCIEKTFTINSELGFNKKDSLFISQLSGSIETEEEKNIRSSIVKGKIKNKKIIIEKKDVPNYLNLSKFRIKEESLYITVPKKFETIELLINNELINTEINQKNQIIVPLDDIIDSEISFKISYTLYNDLTSQKAESIVTELQKEIEISFNNEYKKIPSVILTIDKDNKLYSGYSLDFEQDENLNYIGVKISFENLKRKKEYGDINITIIGEPNA